MMELTACAFIVTLVSSVIATPYGYGVKGGAGAAATAGSAALAGTYGNRGDIPESIPFGNGFSGSFSKSSSSSSASSSASSSSSSFSFSGSGAGAFSGPGAGCTSGTCQTTTYTNDIGNHGSNGAIAGLHDTANAAAAAGSGAAGAGCQGASCDNNSGKCLTGQCHNKQAETNGYDSNNKCASGRCGTTSPSHYDDSKDIEFTHSSKSDLNSKDESSSHDKTTGYSANCHGGNCGSSTTFNSQPNYAQDAPNPHINSGIALSHVPATHLETPKQDYDCQSTGSCNTDHSVPSYGSSQTSYNAPIHGSFDSNKQMPRCNDGKCDNPQKGGYSSSTSNSLSTNYLSPQESHAVKGLHHNQPSPIGCSGSHCNPVAISGKPESTGVHLAVPLAHSSPISPNSCSSPNCNPHYRPGTQTGSNIYPGQAAPIDNTKPSNEKLPSYTGGFGGPAGQFKPNDFNAPATGTVNLGQGPSHGIVAQPSYSSNNPSVNANLPKPNVPAYTGGFGGPTGMLKPNDYNIATSIPTKPTYSASPAYNTPSTIPTGCSTPNCIGTAPGALQPTHAPNHSYNPQTATSSITPGCTTPNCNVYSSTAGATAAANAQAGSYGFTKPSSSEDSSEKLPPYTGGFGGPAGLLKPNEYSPPPTAPSSHNPSYSGTTPSKVPASNSVPGCSTPNCYPTTGGATIGTNQLPFGHPKPSSPTHQPSVSSPGFTTNYYKPTVPVVVPTSPGFATTQPHTGTYSTGCTTGNCNAYPANGVTHPTAPTSTGYNTNCKTSDCANTPSANAGANSQSSSYAGSKPQIPSYASEYSSPSTPNDHSKPTAGTPTCSYGNCNPSSSPSSPGHNALQSGAHASAASSASANAVVYTGGFGGPAGFLTPNDDGKVDLAKIANGQNHYGAAGNAGHSGTQLTLGGLAGSAAGATAFSGSVAGSNSGSYGFNTHGTKNQPGHHGVKGASPCGGGCDGGYHDGVHGSDASTAAAARSLSSAGSISAGGNFASSSASAHSSAGAYTKGGYGKR